MFRLLVWDLEDEAKAFLSSMVEGEYGSDASVLELDPKTNPIDYYKADSRASDLLVAFSDVAYLSFKSLFGENLYTSNKFIKYTELEDFVSRVGDVLGLPQGSLRGYLPEKVVVEEKVITPQGTAGVEALLGSMEELLGRQESQVADTNLQQVNVKLLHERDELRSQVEKLKKSEESFSSLLVAAKTTIQNLKDTTVSRKEYLDLESANLTLQRKVNELNGTNLSLEEENTQLQASLGTANNTVHEKDLLISSLEEQLSVEKDKTNIDDLNAEVENLRQTLEAENAELRKEVEELSKGMRAANSKVLSLTSQQPPTPAQQPLVLPTRFTRHLGTATLPPPVPQVVTSHYKGLRFIFTGSPLGSRSVYNILQRVVKGITEDKAKKAILVDLSSHSFNYYRFGTANDKRGVEWLEKGGDIRNYLEKATKGRNDRELFYSLGGFASYINDFSFYFTDFHARFKDLEALNEEVVVYLGDASSGFGLSMFASLARNNQVEVMLPTDTFSIGTLFSTLLGTKPPRENVLIRFCEFSSDFKKYYNNLKSGKYQVSIYSRKAGS